jgi:hypothetical protein
MEDEVRCIYSIAKMFMTPLPPRDLANTFEKDTPCHWILPVKEIESACFIFKIT